MTISSGVSYGRRRDSRGRIRQISPRRCGCGLNGGTLTAGRRAPTEYIDNSGDLTINGGTFLDKEQ
jgi:hypothetical protein